MKKKSFRIEIQEPCLESWKNMSPTEQGAFCRVCMKEVIDFSKKTPQEIAAYFAKKPKHTCGKFLAKQLEESYEYYLEAKQNKLKYVAGLVLGLLVTKTANAKQANDSIKINQIEKLNYISTKEVAIGKDSVEVRGKILDSTTNEALSGLFVHQKYSFKGVYTDTMGWFKISVNQSLLDLPLEINSGVQLIASYPINNYRLNDTIIILLEKPLPEIISHLAGGVCIKYESDSDDVYSQFNYRVRKLLKKRKK